METAKRQVNLFNHFKKWLLFKSFYSRNRCVAFFLCFVLFCSNNKYRRKTSRRRSVQCIVCTEIYLRRKVCTHTSLSIHINTLNYRARRATHAKTHTSDREKKQKTIDDCCLFLWSSVAKLYYWPMIMARSNFVRSFHRSVPHSQWNQWFDYVFLSVYFSSCVCPFIVWLDRRSNDSFIRFVITVLTVLCMFNVHSLRYFRNILPFFFVSISTPSTK